MSFYISAIDIKPVFYDYCFTLYGIVVDFLFDDRAGLISLNSSFFIFGYYLGISLNRVGSFNFDSLFYFFIYIIGFIFYYS